MPEHRWPLAQAEAVARELVTYLTPACERIGIAGSIRRKKADVGDIELLCIPKPVDMTVVFPSSPFEDLIALNPLLYKRKNAKGTYTYGPLNKYMVHVPSGIPVDIFTATEENWGRDLMVRTGSANFNKRVMARFIDLGMRGHAYGPYAATRGMAQIKAPDESTMFALLQWPYIPPEDRT